MQKLEGQCKNCFSLVLHKCAENTLFLSLQNLSFHFYCTGLHLRTILPPGFSLCSANRKLEHEVRVVNQPLTTSLGCFQDGWISGLQVGVSSQADPMTHSFLSLPLAVREATIATVVHSVMLYCLLRFPFSLLTI